MTVKDLLDELVEEYDLDGNPDYGKALNYELQFHYNCICYDILKLDRIDHKNKRIILGEYFPNKNTKHEEKEDDG